MRNILLVEDDPDVAETIISVLEGFYSDIHIEHIIDGNGFRQNTWMDKNWSLVVLDLMMPGITGFEVCELLKRNPSTRTTPILALTGYDTLQNEQKIRRAGASGYLAKPFEVSKFNEEVQKILK